MREAVFSSLGDITGCRVLDLYAGSGALGIEALSRGAVSAVLVEQAAPAIAAIRRNLRDLDLAEAEVLAMTVARAVRGFRGRGFDLIFADPPYADLTEAAEAITALCASEGAVERGGRIVLEHASRDAPPVISEQAPTRTRKYGDTAVSFYVVAP